MDHQMLAPGTCIVRNTAGQKGRTRSVAPGRTPLRHLHYGRIILDASDQPIDFPTNEFETALICIAGRATIGVAARSYALDRFDALYVPRDQTIHVAPGDGGCDLAEIAAPVARTHPVQRVSFAEVQANPGLHFHTGGPGALRDLNILVGKNVEAGRIMAGVTFSEPGNWTSWPPHEHAAMLEEAYLYVDMPAPAYGVQLVYTNVHEPEVATIVHEGDVVIMPAGYHPNVAAPGASIGFIWMMAAHREDVDRQYGVVNVQPEFAAIGSGLDRGRTERP